MAYNTYAYKHETELGVGMAVTQKQIAEKLGITQAAVALALNGRAGVGEETREKIEATAREMGYHRLSNGAARAMAAKRHGQRARTGSIGCSMPTNSPVARLPYNIDLLEGIRNHCAQAGMELMLLSELPHAQGEKLDGLLVHGGSEELRQRSLPIVALMSAPEGLPAVVADEETGIEQAVRHLVELGHRRIAYLIHDMGQQLEQRKAAYRGALLAAGIEPRAEWIGQFYHVGDMLDNGRFSMRHWLENGWSELGCTALLVQNDRAAIGAMAVLREAGVRLPQDVSIIGFDSTDECELCWPRLTSVQVPLYDMGLRATEMLLQLIDEKRLETTRVTFPTKLELRDSTCPVLSPES